MSGNTRAVLLVRRTCSVVLVVAALFAWADADTPSLAVTRFALTVAAVAALGLAVSFAAGSRPLPASAPEPVGSFEPSLNEQQLAFALWDEG